MGIFENNNVRNRYVNDNNLEGISAGVLLQE